MSSAFKRNPCGRKGGLVSLSVAAALCIAFGVVGITLRTSSGEESEPLPTTSLVSVSEGATAQMISASEEQSGLLISADGGYSGEINGVFNGDVTLTFGFADYTSYATAADFRIRITDITDSANTFTIKYRKVNDWGGGGETGALVEYDLNKDGSIAADGEIRSSHFWDSIWYNNENAIWGENILTSPVFPHYFGNRVGTMSLVWEGDTLQVQVPRHDNANMRTIAAFDGTDAFVSGESWGLPKLSFPKGYTISIEAADGGDYSPDVFIKSIAAYDETTDFSKETQESAPVFYQKLSEFSIDAERLVGEGAASVAGGEYSKTIEQNGLRVTFNAGDSTVKLNTVFTGDFDLGVQANLSDGGGFNAVRFRFRDVADPNIFVDFRFNPGMQDSSGWYTGAFVRYDVNGTFDEYTTNKSEDNNGTVWNTQQISDHWSTSDMSDGFFQNAGMTDFVARFNGGRGGTLGSAYVGYDYETQSFLTAYAGNAYIIASFTDGKYVWQNQFGGFPNGYTVEIVAEGADANASLTLTDLNGIALSGTNFVAARGEQTGVLLGAAEKTLEVTKESYSDEGALLYTSLEGYTFGLIDERVTEYTATFNDEPVSGVDLTKAGTYELTYKGGLVRVVEVISCPHAEYGAWTANETGNGVVRECAQCGEKQEIQLGLSATLTLEDEVKVNYILQMKNDAGAEAILSASVYVYDNANEKGEPTVISMKASETGGYRAENVRSYAAKEIGDSHWFRLEAELNGVKLQTQLQEYSPRIYAMNMLKSESASDETKNLALAMLDYAAAAQTYFGYKVDAITNADVTEEMRAEVEAYRDTVYTEYTEYVGQTFTEPFDYPVSMSLNLDGKVSINGFLTAEEGHEVVMKVYKNAEDAVADVAAVDTVIMTFVGGRYRGTTQNKLFAAKEFGDEVYIVFYVDGEAATAAIRYGVKDYAYRMLVKQPTAEEKALYESILNYGAAAQIAFGYNSGNLANAGLNGTEN